MNLKPHLALAALGFTLIVADPAAAEDIRCGSSPGANNYCRTDTSHGVELRYQHSSYGCYQNDTWGFDRGGIWVSNGCSATFQVGEREREREREREDNSAAAVGLGLLALAILGNSGADQNAAAPPPPTSYPGQNQGGYSNNDQVDEDEPLIVPCSSKNNKYKLCPVRVPGYVKLVRQKSASVCRFNKSWGYDRRGIWVSKGCRAEFAVY